MIEKIDNIYEQILAVRQDGNVIENIVLGPVEDMRTFGPLTIDPARYAKFLINDIQAIRNKSKVEFFDHIDPKRLLVLLTLCDLNWFSRKDLVEFLEQKLNDVIRDSE